MRKILSKIRRYFDESYDKEKAKILCEKHCMTFILSGLGGLLLSTRNPGLLTYCGSVLLLIGGVTMLHKGLVKGE